MSKANAKAKAPKASKQAKQKLNRMMRNLKTQGSSSSKVMSTCTRYIYCI